MDNQLPNAKKNIAGSVLFPRRKVLSTFFILMICFQLQLKAQVTYHLGNSLTDTNNDMLSRITLSAGKSHTYLRTTIPGAPTDWIWDHPGGANGEGDYRTVFLTRTIDHLFTQPFAGHCRSISNEAEYSGKFFLEARKNNVNVQHWLYMQWPSISFNDCWSKGEGGVDGTVAANWIEGVCNHRIYFEKAREMMDQQHPGKSIRIMPSGLALAKLKIEIEEGRVPGMTDFYTNTFSDDLHLNDKGAYLVSLTHYVGIYGESPTGRVTFKPTSLTEQQAGIYKQIAWDVVSDYPWSGLGGSGTLANEICSGGGTNPPPPPPVPTSGNVEREYWANIPGTAVSDIPLNTAPTSKNLITSLEGPVNSADNYGTRIRGYIVPSTEGWYNLYIAGDDNAELWFSSGPDPADKSRVAYVSSWTNSREWTRFPEQKSSQVYLVSGGKFYFEVLHKEASGGDNIAVAWTGPGITTPAIIAGVNLDRYSPSDTQAPSTPTGLTSTSKTSSSVSLSWTASTDNVGVTGYEIYLGSSATPNKTSTNTTTTVTGLSPSTAYSFTVKAKDAAGNLSAASAALSVTTNTGGTAGVTREYWSNVSGTAISAIPLSTPPTGTEQVTSLEGPLNWGDNYGARIRAFVMPTTTGSYTFYLAGDDNCELWLSTDANPANKVKVAEVTGWTNSREWGKYASQTSVVKSLTANTSYYIEILHKEGNGGDNVAAAWTGPGISAITVIGGSNLSAYTSSPAITKLEAESALLSGGAGANTNHMGYSGPGFVDGYWNPGATTSFTYNAASAGTYNVKLRYANGSGSGKSLSVYVNNVKIRQISLANLADWSTWGDKVEALTLVGGNNTIAYKYDAGDGGNVNLDFVEISLQTNTATLSAMSIEREMMNLDSEEEKAQVYPNPVDNTMHVTLYSESKKDAEVQIVDHLGTPLIRHVQKLHKGDNSFVLNTSSLPDGLYILKVKTDKKSFQKRIAVKK